MTSLLTRLLRRGPSSPSIPVTVYTREGCCCCHKAIDVLESFRRTYSLEIDLVDVDSDPQLAADYGLTVPVVAIDGKVRFKGLVNPVLLERILSKRES